LEWELIVLVYCMPVQFRTHVYNWQFAGLCMQGETTQRHEVCAWLLESPRKFP